MYTIYQITARMPDGQVQKYIGYTSNLTQRVHSHKWDASRPMYRVMNEAKSVKVESLGQTGSKKIAIVAEANAIRRTSKLARKAVVVNKYLIWKK